MSDEHVEGLNEARSGAPARQGPRPGVHGEAASAGGRILGEPPAESRPGQSAPHNPRAGERGPHAIGVVAEEASLLLETAREPYPGALQFLPASPDSAGRLLNLNRRSLCGKGGRGAPQPPAYFRVASGAARRRRRVRETHPGVTHAADLPASRDGRGPAGPVHALPEERAEAGFEAGIELAVSAVLVAPVPVPRRTRAGVRRMPGGTASAIWRWRPGSRFSCGAGGSPTTNCSMCDRRENSASQPCWKRKCAGCSRTPAHGPREQFRRAVAAPAPTFQRHRARPAAFSRLRRQPAAGVPSRDRNASSRPSCATTAAC